MQACLLITVTHEMHDHQFTTAGLMMDESFRAWAYNTDAAAVKQWEQWLLAHPDQHGLVTEAKALLLYMQVKPALPDEAEVDAVKQRLDALLDARKKGGRVVGLRKWASVAAAAVLVTGMMTYYFLEGQDMQVTDYAHLRTVTLPDGSTVLMNAHSNIRFKKHWFSWKEREVWLDGEAFFTVTKKPAGFHPKFVVHANGLDVNVVGTEFNVYSRRNRVDVVLEQGKVVANTTTEGPPALHFEMHPGQWLELKGNKLAAREVDPEEYTQWRHERLSFNDRPIREIIQVLEDNYGYKVQWKSAHSQDETFTGSCRANNAPLLLQAIASAFDMRVTIHDKTVVFE